MPLDTRAGGMTMDHATARALIETIFRDVVDGGQYSNIAEYFDPDFVDHSAIGDAPGYEGFIQMLEGFRAALPGFRHDISDVTVIDDTTLMWQTHTTATFTGEFMGARGAGQ